MSASAFIQPTDQARICPDCEAQAACRSVRAQEFTYGRGPEAIALTTEVPIWTCSECGYQFGEGEAEELRHEAVCRHLGVMTPAEIVELRAKLGLTQKQLADLTKVGEASIKRWEAGNVIQNASADLLLRIAADAAGRTMLHRVAQKQRQVAGETNLRA